MRHKLSQHLTFAAAFLVLILFVVQQLWFKPNFNQQTADSYADKVNLALRLTANLLLREEGDSTSAIPPVKMPAPNVFLLKLNRDFNYDTLPYFLERALLKHGIKGAYDVAVLDCETQELLLGYTADTRNGAEWAPCGGRLRANQCYNLKFTAPPPVITHMASLWRFAIPFAIVLLLGGYIILYLKGGFRSAPDQAVDVGSYSGNGHQQNGNGLHRLGQFTFDPDNQLLIRGSLRQELTYRESKLLRYLCRHPNQLLERDQILKEVWEDEGIVVGRSLDVFISRLRKKLNGDESVKITSVHGVGYKLEAPSYWAYSGLN
ncbi:MAG TPA: winged helix-turn-helix domain-containing protein [Flavilitoribacter sp.]|nr:winged helix-turn-helix domain-containing protein [Flavilitoribacter sp.]HMQ86243.1 winged helix-turn-helix domain-containing protein [Flavilitoribacter sp.]